MILILLGAFAVVLGAFIFFVVPLGSPARRAIAATVFVGMVVGAFLGAPELLSRPKPVQFEWLRSQAESAEVVSSVPVEDVGIYLWLRLPDSPEPRAYVLPWSLAAAKQLEEAKAEAGDRGLELQMPFQHSWDERDLPVMHPMPQPMLPPKDASMPDDSGEVWSWNGKS